jgi:hypothetical protein
MSIFSTISSFMSCFIAVLIDADNTQVPVITQLWLDVAQDAIDSAGH